MRGQFGFINLRGYRGGDNRGAVFVSDIVLYYQHRAQSTLFGADNRR
jgi:hypothetical protein